MDVYVQKKKIRLLPAMAVGKGGEADVYDIGQEKVLKLFKGPEHPDLDGMPEEQVLARERLAERAHKLPAFPRLSSPAVVTPEELAYDKHGSLVGYTMRLVPDAEPLYAYADPKVRRTMSGSAVARTLVKLHDVMSAVHGDGIVIGDFNDLNVLVKDGDPWLIDADSFQFGPYLCRVFTERFLDPLTSAPDAMMLAKPCSVASDRYAFAALAFQSLLCVAPYGGIHRPKDASRRLNDAGRRRRRVTVLHPEVVYPKPAIPVSVLPDDLLQGFHEVFEEDNRGALLRPLLDGLTFSRCPACGAEHARSICPSCAPSAPAAVTSVTVARGEVLYARVVETKGVIVTASFGQDLSYLVHEGGEYKREDKTVVLRGDLDPSLRFALAGDATIVARGGNVAVIRPGVKPSTFALDVTHGAPSFAVSGDVVYGSQGGRLMAIPVHPERALAKGSWGEPLHVGDVLAGHTRVWAGPTFGIGFYRAGNVSVGFTFDAGKRGLRDHLKIPFPPGKLLDAAAYLDDRRAFLLLATDVRGRRVNVAFAISRLGEVEAATEMDAGSPGFLGDLSGKYAVGGVLFAATEAGIVRVEVKDRSLVEAKRFPDTEPFVGPSSELIAGASGLFVVEPRRIGHVKMG